MASPRYTLSGMVLGLLFLASIVSPTAALTAEYCSPLNTAQTPDNSSIFQSNGLCTTFCTNDWAFAILSFQTCWCSNDAPSSTTSAEACSQTCPGYPDDLCGNPAEGLFGYFALSKSPTATVGGSSSSAAASSTSTSQSTSDSSTTPSTTTSSSSSTSSSSVVSSPSSSSTWTATPVTALTTVTGKVQTVTITPTIPPSSASLSESQSKSGGGGLGTGGAVGLTIGLVALVALVSSIVYFCIRKRQKENQRQMEELNEGSRRGSSAGLGGPIPSRIPSRTMSENSRYVLGTDGRQVVETWEPETRDAPGSRRSRLMPVDPRLDPFAPVYQRGENKSRESINTIRDDHDYSRRVQQQAPILRATNPDD